MLANSLTESKKKKNSTQVKRKDRESVFYLKKEINK